MILFALLVARPLLSSHKMSMRFLRHRLVGKVQRYSERNGSEPREFVDSYWSQLRESKMTFSSVRVFGHRDVCEENFAELNTTSKHLLFSFMFKRNKWIEIMFILILFPGKSSKSTCHVNDISWPCVLLSVHVLSFCKTSLIVMLIIIHRLFSRWINVDEMSILKNEEQEHLCVLHVPP